MPTAQADKFKAKLWQAWSDMQKILKAFLAVPLNLAKYEELCEQIMVNNGLMQVSLQIDDLTDSLVQVRNVYQSDLRS